MACITSATWCPNSYQLRYAFNCGKSHKILVQTRFWKLDRKVRVFSAARNGDGNEVARRRNVSSWMSVKNSSSADTFSGWSGSDGAEEFGDLDKKPLSKGIVGAGVVGVILVAGLTFASLSLSKRIGSRTKQQMEPLTTQQEVSLVTDAENDRFEDEGEGTKDTVQDNSTQDSNKGIDMDSSSPDLSEASIDNKSGDDTDIGISSLDNLNTTTSDNEAINKASVEDDLQDESAFDDTSVAPNMNPRTKQQMEPLTTQQEVSLATDAENDRFEDEGEGTKDTVQDNSTQDSNKGIDMDSSSPDLSEASIDNKSGDDTDIGISSLDNLNTTTSDNEAINKASVEDDLQDESAFDDTSVAPNMNPRSPDLPDNEIVDPSTVAFDFKDPSGVAAIELTSQLRENLVDVEPTSSFISDVNPTSLNIDNEQEIFESGELSMDSSYSSSAHIPSESMALTVAVSSQLDTILDLDGVYEDDIKTVISPSIKEDLDLSKQLQVSAEGNNSLLEVHNLSESVLSGSVSVSTLTDPTVNEQDTNGHNEMDRIQSIFDSPTSRDSFSSAGIPAPSALSAALQVLPGKVLVPAFVDQVQGHTLAALQVLKVIEADVQPSDLCTRREYARWLVSASSALLRNTSSKVYPAMYIENVTELAFDDITPEDPDFSSIQGLAEAGLISSKLSRHDLLPSDEDQSPFFFSPESPLSRQDLVSWKMALEKRQLPEANKKILYQLSGFIDIDKISPDAWPALVADISAGEQGIVALAFGYTRLFQPDKPVTTAQAAVALAIGEASEIVSEELARIEAESMAENAVTAHSALVAQVEQDINASFEKALSLEREKINAVEKLAEEAKEKLEKLLAQREEDNFFLMKERAAVESEMEVLSRLRGEVEEQLQSLMSNKVEISYEKERISKLRKEAEIENQEIARLQYELEVERKALSMARTWAEDEAKRAREQAKVLEEARFRWEKHGIKVVVDKDLQEDASAGVTWLNAGKQFSVEETVSRGENLVEKLKVMGTDVRGKSREIINRIIQKILAMISILREYISEAGRQTGKLKDVAISKARGSAQEFKQTTVELKDAAILKASKSAQEFKRTTVELKDAAILKASESAQEFQQSTAGISLAVKEGAKRVAGDCRDGVEKLTQKFKT